MNLGSKFILFFIILISINGLLVIADDPPTFDPTNFDYMNGDYNTVVWSQISDWSKINWDKVNWETFDWNLLDEAAYKSLDFSKVPEKYADKVDAKKAIDAGRGKDLPANIIAANFDEVDEINDLDLSKAADAVKQKYGITISENSFGPSANIRGGVLSTSSYLTEGIYTDMAEIDSLELTSKNGWAVRIDDNGVISAAPAALNQGISEITDSAISIEDHFNIEGIASYTTEDNLKATLEGASFNGKQMYVKKGNIGLVAIDNDEGSDFLVDAKKDIDIYLGQVKDPQANYIQLIKGPQTFVDDDTKAKMEKLGFKAGEEVTNKMVINSVSDEDIIVYPLPGNRLFNMVKRQYSTEPGVLPTLVADYRDELKITVSPGAKVDIQSRTSIGEIPLLTQSGSGEVTIRTGRGIVIKASEDRLAFTPPEAFSPSLHEPSPDEMINDKNTVPMRIITSNPNNDQLQVSSSNQYTVWNGVHGEFEEDLVTFMSTDGKPTSSYIEDNLIKSIADLKQEYPSMDFKIRAGVVDGVYTPDEYQDITPSMAQ
ncbi:MAG: hypothetical protein AABX05_05345, partial [Nanoarchaeota archaeon]